MHVVFSILILLFLQVPNGAQAAVCDYQGFAVAPSSLDNDCDWVLMARRENSFGSRGYAADGQFSYFFDNYRQIKDSTGAVVATECIVNNSDNISPHVLITWDKWKLLDTYFSSPGIPNPYTALAEAYRKINNNLDATGRPIKPVGARTFRTAVTGRLDDCRNEISTTTDREALQVIETTDINKWIFFYLPTRGK